jgi:hypothetical protein
VLRCASLPSEARASCHSVASRPWERDLALPYTSAYIQRDPAPHSLREHRLERAVAAPEMVVECGRGMQRNNAEEKEPDRLLHLQEPLRERAVPADQRRQVAEEEQVHPIAMRVGVEKPEDRLGRQEGVERVFAPLRREPHCLRHVSRPVGEAGKLAKRADRASRPRRSRRTSDAAG